jgi:hypothetical protein
MQHAAAAIHTPASKNQEIDTENTEKGGEHGEKRLEYDRAGAEVIAD